MSQFNAGSEKGYVAAVDIPNGTAVKFGANGTVTPATAATDAIIGVTNGKAYADKIANVRLRSAEGTVKVLLGGTVNAGDRVTSNGSGQAITTTTAGNEVVGIAVEGGVAGDLVEVMPSTATV